MRNLILKQREQFAIPLNGVRQVLLNPNQHTPADENDPESYLVTADKVYKWQKGEGSKPVEVIEIPAIVSAEYLALEHAVCVATEVGEVLIVNLSTGETTEGTFCPVGIEAMVWSPDQEVVAFVTKERNIVVMTSTYEPLDEHRLIDECNPQGQFVNVGWGKKETQFHGSLGKSAAKEKNEFKPPDNINELPQQIEISWREDSAYFVVSFVHPAVGRMFKVFDKEGKLQFISERQANLQPAINWRPSGNWIAVPQQLPNKSVIALFEKNGLRHRELLLPFAFDTECVKSLRWSPDSTILCIETENAAEQSNNLYLYTINNYHWYLKQVLRFEMDEHRIATHTWDNRIGEEKRLHIVLASGTYLSYRWRSSVVGSEDNYLAVIDGKKVLLSDQNENFIPPPMCNKELEFKDWVLGCAFDKKGGLCVYDASQRFHVFELSQPDMTSCDFRPSLPWPCWPLEFGHFAWLNEEKIVTFSCRERASTISLIGLMKKVGSETEDEPQYQCLSTLALESTVTAMSNASDGELVVQTSDGRVHRILSLATGTERLSVSTESSFLLPQAEELTLFTDETGRKSLITLTQNHCLYCDGERIATDVTSYRLLSNYVVFTKLSQLLFWRIAERQIVCERKIERGGRLVNIKSSDGHVVLQMPRGNLETFKPRLLTLEVLAEHLERSEYKQAMALLRKERINSNVICDHNMLHFLDDMERFIGAIDDPAWLNLFINELQNEDITKTMYGTYYKADRQSSPPDFRIEEKVQLICGHLCAFFRSAAEPSKYRLPLITALVKVGQLPEALQLIWKLKLANDAAADEALNYLLYLVDVNELYNVALGTYDFGLVMYVAQKSQKDPKEFLPFLKELHQLDEHYRKFKIDEHLKRYDQAINHLANCGVERVEEALKFIVRHALYPAALRSYENNHEVYQRICLAYGDYLRANGKLESASVLYERGGNYQQACASAKNTMDWRRALVMAKLSGHSVKETALSMVPALQENDRFEEAFMLLKSYANDTSGALKCLVKGKLFLRAIFEARMLDAVTEGGDYDPIKTLVEPELQAYHSMLDMNLQSDLDVFNEYKQRLLSVREANNAKKDRGQDYELHAENGLGDESDLISDTTSVYSSRYSSSSRGTGKTFRSSKNRRKHERKLLSLKPGNPFEDIALIDALYNLIMKITAQQQHVRDTCLALIEIRQDEIATRLQRRFKSLLETVQNSLDEIWIPEIMAAQQFLTGPNIDYTLLQNEQRYSMINPQKRFKPQLNILDWENELLK